jgi:hypothetical protein
MTEWPMATGAAPPCRARRPPRPEREGVPPRRIRCDEMIHRGRGCIEVALSARGEEVAPRIGEEVASRLHRGRQPAFDRLG